MLWSLLCVHAVVPPLCPCCRLSSSMRTRSVFLAPGCVSSVRTRSVCLAPRLLCPGSGSGVMSKMAALLRLSSGLCRVCAGAGRAPRGALHSAGPAADYRSVYSLERLYPRAGPAEGAQVSTMDIPTDRLAISYSRSSGPGGQNVNKVNTKAEVRFHLAAADWISEDVRQKIAEKYKNKINKAGELIVTSEVSRYQMRNLADCLQKIREMITQSSPQPKETKKEAAELRRIGVQAMNRERLLQKKLHSMVKQSRRTDMD